MLLESHFSIKAFGRETQVSYNRAAIMMTSAQFYTAIGLPIFSILLVWLGSTVANNRALGALGQRIEDISKRIDDLGRRIDDQGKALGQRIDDLGKTLGQRIDRLETRFDRVEDEIRKDHEGRLARLEARVFSHTA
jgi:hypothetical protein